MLIYTSQAPLLWCPEVKTAFDLSQGFNCAHHHCGDVFIVHTLWVFKCAHVFGSQPRVWANVIDISPAHAGYLLGIVNTVGTLPGMLGNSTTGTDEFVSFLAEASVCSYFVFDFRTPLMQQAGFWSKRVPGRAFL